MAGKHKREDVDNYESVEEPILAANASGVTSSLSPLKRGRKSKYFDGTVSDGKSKLRLVPNQKLMDDLMPTKHPVELVDCQIKQARRGSKMEISLKRCTKISKSEKEFDIAAIDFGDEGPAAVHLSEVSTKEVLDRVSVHVKVIKAMEPESVSRGKRVQEIVVADETGMGKVNIWEENIGMLKENKSYLLENFFVREYAAAKVLVYGVKSCGLW